MSLVPAEFVDKLVARRAGASASGPSASGGEVGSDTRPAETSVDAERALSLDWLSANGLPTHHDEAWKYTPLKELLARPIDRLADLDESQSAEVSPTQWPSLPDEIRVVMVDGVFRADLSSETVGSGVTIGAIGSDVFEMVDLTSSAPTDADSRSVRQRDDGFQMLNKSFGIDGVVIAVPEQTIVERPIHVVHLSGVRDEVLLVQPRVDIHLAVDSQATVIESFAYSSSTAFVNAHSSVVLENNAILRHYKIQAQAVGSVHLSNITARQATGSALKAGAFMFGASISRQAIDVTAIGDHTNTELYGLYLPHESQQMDNVVTVEHAGRNGTSHQTYKGVIDDRARGSFSGHIVVDHGTLGTDAHQSNKTLLLDTSAQSDSRPWLEIFADDVNCTHGSAIGQLDEKALFYMRSRGIALDDARAVLVGGFINEIVERLLTDSVRELVLDLVKAQVRTGFTAELGGDS